MSATLAMLAPGLPRIATDLNTGVVALLVNLAVIVRVSAFVRRPLRK